MSVSKPVLVKSLGIDLSNYRTTTQIDERGAVEAIIAINPEWFWALAESLMDSGYLPTENVLVIRSDGKPSLIVMEGNRRVAALKLMLGHIPLDGLVIPASISKRIANLTTAWKRENKQIPCVAYDASEIAVVKKIRGLTHGKGEKAGRDAWTAVARARHNRAENNASEPALELLEKYLAHGQNLTERQAALWSGDFRLTVLEEAMKRYAVRVGATSAPDLCSKYPKIQYLEQFEALIHAIGLEQVTFDKIRHGGDVALHFGIPELPSTSSGSRSTAGSKSAGQAAQAGSAAAKSTTTTKKAALATGDPRQVTRLFKGFSPKGQNREKVVDLKLEITQLKLLKNPIAFCFLLRSMFEISAKVYAKENGIKATKSDGTDKKLVELLREITNHLTSAKTDKAVLKVLHGALTELARGDGLLSVTSMNQLVHNPKFSLQPSDVAVLSANVFPLLEAINA